MIILLASNLAIFQYFQAKNTVTTFLYENDLFKPETHWILKEINGEASGYYDSYTKVVEYVYVKKEVSRDKKETILSNNLDITVEQKHSLHGGKDKDNKPSVTGKIARVMSGRILYGKVKTQ